MRGNRTPGCRRTNAKLSPAIIEEARLRHASGESYARLAQVYEVSKSTILRACNATTWADPPPPDPIAIADHVTSLIGLAPQPSFRARLAARRAAASRPSYPLAAD